MNRVIWVLMAMLLTGCGVAGGLATPVSPTPVADECGVIGTVSLRFVIPEGQDYRDVLPEMGLSPELEGVSGATVIVYAGVVELTNLGGIPGASRESRLMRAICVITPSGEPLVYSNVSRGGMRVPGPTVQPSR